jgi:POT family proton-dependent oligopeptide transporter
LRVFVIGDCLVNSSIGALPVPGRAAPAAEAVGGELFGHPKGLFVCFFTEMWERFSFYGMKALLLLYMLKHHRFGDELGYLVLGAYAGLVYAVPVVGGMFADRLLGMRKAVVFGGVLLCCGHLGMAYEGGAATVDTLGAVHRDAVGLLAFYVSLALIICGVGFLKPNVATLVGLLYPPDDPRRDAGFTLYYAGINLGALFASLICGYVGEVYGWRYGFGAAGLGMFAGLGVFLGGQAHLRGLAEPPDPARLQARLLGPLNVEQALYAGTLLAALVIAGLLNFPRIVASAQVVMLVVWLAWLAWYLARHADRVQRERMLSILVFITFVLLFFALYEQTYAAWVTFTDRMMDKDLFPALVIRDGDKHLPWSILPLAVSPMAVLFALRQRSGRAAAVLLSLLTLLAFAFILRDCVVLPQTAGSLTYLGGLFIVLLAPLFSWLWPWLGRRGRNPRKSTKCVIGLALAGLSFLPLVAANDVAASGRLASVWWLALAYAILEVGEVCLSPITLAAISELTMPKVAAVMMSGWLLATSFSEQVAAGLSSLASLEIQPGAQVNLAEAAVKYGALFHNMIWLGLASAGLALALSPLLRRWMHGIH